MKLAIASISIEKPLVKRAKERAKARRQSLSSYLCSLIELDLLREQTVTRKPANKA